MPDETREALERALAAGGPPGEHTRRITDAIDARIDARVRALATGAETTGATSPPSPERDGPDVWIAREALDVRESETRQLATYAGLYPHPNPGRLVHYIPASRIEAAERIAEERRERAKRAEAKAEHADGAARVLAEQRKAFRERCAELDGALRTLHLNVFRYLNDDDLTADWMAHRCDEALRALTPSAAKPEAAAIAKLYDAAPPPEPAAKGDGAKCGTCGGTGLVDGAAICCVASPLPPAAKGAK